MLNNRFEHDRPERNDDLFQNETEVSNVKPTNRVSETWSRRLDRNVLKIGQMLFCEP